MSHIEVQIRHALSISWRMRRRHQARRADS